MKVIVLTEKDFLCVKLWFSRAFPDGDFAEKDIDAFCKIECFYHASEAESASGKTRFRKGPW